MNTVDIARRSTGGSQPAFAVAKTSLKLRQHREQLRTRWCHHSGWRGRKAGAACRANDQPARCRSSLKSKAIVPNATIIENIIRAAAPTAQLHSSHFEVIAGQLAHPDVPPGRSVTWENI